MAPIILAFMVHWSCGQPNSYDIIVENVEGEEKIMYAICCGLNVNYLSEIHVLRLIPNAAMLRIYFLESAGLISL